MTNKKKKYSLREQIGYLFSSKVLALGIQLIIPLVLVRMLSKDEYGIYLQFLLIGQLLGSIIAFGIQSSIYFFYPNAKKYLNQLISQTFFLLVIFSLFFLPVYYILRHQISIFFSISPQLINLGGIFILFFTISILLDHIFVVEQKSNYVFIFEILNITSRVAFIIISFVIFRSIIAMAWSLLLFNFIKTVFLFVYLNANYTIIYDFRKWHKPYLISQLKFSYPLGFANIVNRVGSNIDKLILSAFFSASDFAVYSVAKYRVPIINLLFPSASNVIIPQMSKNRQEGNIEEVKRLWHKLIIALAVPTIPCTVYFFVIAEKLVVFLYTEEYISAANLYRIVILTFFVLILRGNSVLTAYGKTKFTFYAQLSSNIFGIVFGYLIIKNYGTIGAAITFTSVSFFRGLLLQYMTKKVLNLELKQWLPWKNLGKIIFCSLVPVPFIIPFFLIDWPNFILLGTTFIFYSGILLLIYNKLRIVDLPLTLTQIRNLLSMRKPA